MKAFVDYYRANAISPVAQDLTDVERHFDRRNSLYRALGLPPRFVQGRSVIEFGPGSGYNAVHTLALEPSRYALVEGNPVGAARTREMLREYGHAVATQPEVIETLVEDFSSEERFDIVLCEGTIPFQNDPVAFTRKIASFCAPGGVTVITTVSSASCMGELARRLIAARIVDVKAPVGQRLEALRPVFAPHLATMKSMSRSVDDWVLDNIIHPFVGKTFGIDRAIDALDDEFDIYGTSPQFVQDWRWYKACYGDAKAFNQRAKDAYHRYVANFLDYRVELAPHDAALGRQLDETADEIYTLMQGSEEGDVAAGPRAVERLSDLGELIAPISSITAESLRAAVAFLTSERIDLALLERFASYFGRGQQYVSFMRK